MKTNDFRFEMEMLLQIDDAELISVNLEWNCN